MKYDNEGKITLNIYVSEKEINFYRSTYCGFIFQDYQLIDELTVKENVALSLELKSDTGNKEEYSVEEL